MPVFLSTDDRLPLFSRTDSQTAAAQRRTALATKLCNCSAFKRVPGPGLEPGLPCGKGILSPSRLPVSPSRRYSKYKGESRSRWSRGRTRILSSRHTPTLACPTQSGKRDSNPRPQPWQGCALPTELFPHTTPGSRLATEPNHTRDVSRGTLPSILSTRRPADRSAAPDVPRQWRRGESNP